MQHVAEEIELAPNYLSAEERYYQAKEALRHAQQQKFEATSEFLAARADLRALLEAIFPGTEVERPLTTKSRLLG